MKQFQNPADYIIKLVQAPELCNLDLNFDKLLDNYDKIYGPMVIDEIKNDLEKCRAIETNFRDFAESR